MNEAQKNIVKLACDFTNGKISTNYSEGNPSDIIRNAIIESMGTDKLDYKSIRDGKVNFALLEELITKTIIEGMPSSSPIFNWVENKNGAYGDKPEFVVRKDSTLIVDTVAEGTQGIRRQRMLDDTTVQVNPKVRAVKIYEELARLMAGRVDWTQFVNSVSKAFIRDFNDRVATLISGVYSQVTAPYAQSGNYSETVLLDIVDHVEAATGMNAKIFGTRNALRKVVTAQAGDEVKSDYYNFGYSGKFNGVPCFAIKNGHKAGTTNFILNDTDIIVVAGDDKFIKNYTEGESLIIAGNPLDNADLTQEFAVLEKSDTVVAFANEIGVYRITG